MNIPQLQQWLKLDERKRDLEAELSQIKDDMKAIHDTLLDSILEDGVSSLKVNERTVYIYRQVWAKPVEGKTLPLVHVLEATGLGHIITVNSQSLSAMFRGENVKDVPPDVFNLVETREDVSLRSRKS